MNVYLNLNPFWLKDGAGQDCSVLSVWQALQNTPNEISNRETLTKAYRGELMGSTFATQEKLRRLASQWAGRELTLGELMVVVEDDLSAGEKRRKQRQRL